MLKACVIGWPIKHSKSPLIHSFWLKKYGIKGSYEKIAVAPKAVPKFFENFVKSQFIGCNVTIPHKEKIMPLVTIDDELTHKIGAVNTVYLHEGTVYGLNTDGQGFVSNLKNSHPAIVFNNSHCVVIGAGGASRAIIAVLLEKRVSQISLVNRTLEKAQNLADQFGDKVKPVSFNQLNDVIKTADLLVNTTSLGMIGQPDLNLDLDKLPTKCIVTDIVYTPLQTNLLKQAKAKGNVTIDGLGMLLHQAAPGFEKWFGVFPQIDKELRDMVIANLDEK